MNCLTEAFTTNGFLEEKSGVLLNKRGIFNVNTEAPEESLRALINFSARVGMEITGIQQPLTTAGDNKNTISFLVDTQVNDGSFRIQIENEGIIVRAKTEVDLSKAAEYMTCMFPYISQSSTLLDFKSSYEKKNHDKINIKGMAMSTQGYELEGLKVSVEGDEESYIDKASVQELNSVNSRTTEKNKYKSIKKYLKQSLDRKIVIEELPSNWTEALILLTIRMSLNNFEVTYPILYNKSEGENNIVVVESEENKSEISFEANNVIIRGAKGELYQTIEKFTANYEILTNLTDNAIINEIKEILEAKNELGQIIEALTHMEQKQKRIDEIVTNNYSSAIIDDNLLLEYIRRKTGPEIELRKCNDEKSVINYDYNFTWEGADFIDIIKNEALPLLDYGDEIEIQGVLSEDLDVRCSIEKDICRLVEEAGCKCNNVKIYRSLKPGLSWIEETVIPDALVKIDKGDIDKVVIKFNCFINENGEQKFESESTPNYGQHKDEEDKWFDLPTRWLQELYPADEIISNSFDIKSDNVSFQKVEDLDSTYHIEIYNKEGSVIYRDKYTVKYIKKPYMARYPKIGDVHVTTGWITIRKNNNIVIDRGIDTDMQKVWKVIEKNVLPELEAYFVKKYGKEKLLEMQPLFNKLQIDIKTSEMDYDLGIQEERISTIESLQEDLYFYILDYFKTYGERECGKELDNIGLIIPEIINCKTDNTSVSVKLYEDYSEQPFIRYNNKKCKIEDYEIRLNIDKVLFEESSITLNINIEQDDCVRIHEKLNILEEMIVENKILKLHSDLYYILNFTIGKKRNTLKLNKSSKSDNILSCDEKQEIIDNEIISYDRYLQLLDYYKKYEELNIIPIETTYKGKKIFAVEIIKKDKNIIYSRNKLMLNRRTCLFNARHHANEASSTNSSFLLIDKLVEDSEYQKRLDKINLIILPFENIDGGEIHCRMQKDNPKWLFHVARFNSMGYEFRKDYLNPATKYGEARALPKLWNKWLPDIVTDNHGFESHEFYLQFSGYISPWYKSFWIPRALYYGYIWYDDANQNMKSFGKKLQSKVTEYINAEERIQKLNDYWSKRFYKYAEKWHPDMFNTERYDGLIFYWIEKAARKRSCNFALEFPEITTLDWTTEVADETATEDYLRLNSKAHHISDLAVLELLYETELEHETSFGYENDKLVYCKIRRKPLR